MADAEPDPLAAFPPGLQGPLGRAIAGQPANVVLMQVLMECADGAAAEDVLRLAAAKFEAAGDQAAAGRLGAVLDLLLANPAAANVIRSTLSGLDHARSPHEDDVAYWAAAFNSAARRNPEASVALYALGDPALLRAATAEVVGRLGEWGLLAGRECLDIGCGIGRLELAMADHVARIVGIDIADAMVEEARRRCAGLANVEIRKASGRDLSGFPEASFDLVLAVDAFPYIVASGAALAAAMIGEAARVLRPAGRLVILNFSYRGDAERDRADLAALATERGFRVLRDGTSEFSLWDGLAFDLQKL